jgi:hypothetical protein
MWLARTPAAFFNNGIGLFYSCGMNDRVDRPPLGTDWIERD